jgi:hypothetical protein
MVLFVVLLMLHQGEGRDSEGSIQIAGGVAFGIHQ